MKLSLPGFREVKNLSNLKRLHALLQELSTVQFSSVVMRLNDFGLKSMVLFQAALEDYTKVHRAAPLIQSLVVAGSIRVSHFMQNKAERMFGKSKAENDLAPLFWLFSSTATAGERRDCILSMIARAQLTSHHMSDLTCGEIPPVMELQYIVRANFFLQIRSRKCSVKSVVVFLSSPICFVK